MAWRGEARRGEARFPSPSKGVIDVGHESYPSLAAFYRERRVRWRSSEADFGVWWRDSAGLLPWRVSLVEDTGEVYAVALTAAGDGHVTLLAEGLPTEAFSAYESAARMLRGWECRCGDPHSLAWVRDQLSAYAPSRVAVAPS
jgi:hypothetical protein